MEEGLLRCNAKLDERERSGFGERNSFSLGDAKGLVIPLRYACVRALVLEHGLNCH